MAANPISPLVTVDEYLNSSYSPDKEYVDGFLVERGMPTVAHSILHSLLDRHFGPYDRQFRFVIMINPRTRIVERARYRIPDLLLCPLPIAAGKILTSVPWVVVEILSPNDKMPELFQRFREYTQIGVRHVMLLDPEQLLAYRFENGSLLKTAFTALDLPSGAVPFDSDALFRQLSEKLSEASE